MKCPNCSYDCAPEMNFCGMCGARLARVCPVCQNANPVQFRFCGMCGARLADDAPSLQIDFPSVQDSNPAPSSPAPESNGFQREGQRRICTVLVTDLTGSTSLLEKMGTEAWVTLMNHILRILEGEINRFGGKVHQFREDGVVAIFGMTSAHEDDPERAVLSRAYDEMERKLNLIPPGNDFRRSYLENIPIHREIRANFSIILNK